MRIEWPSWVQSLNSLTLPIGLHYPITIYLQRCKTDTQICHLQQPMGCNLRQLCTINLMKILKNLTTNCLTSFAAMSLPPASLVRRAAQHPPVSPILIGTTACRGSSRCGTAGTTSSLPRWDRFMRMGARTTRGHTSKETINTQEINSWASTRPSWH
jgi:hypothetical protein